MNVDGRWWSAPRRSMSTIRGCVLSCCLHTRTLTRPRRHPSEAVGRGRKRRGVSDLPATPCGEPLDIVGSRSRPRHFSCPQPARRPGSGCSACRRWRCLRRSIWLGRKQLGERRGSAGPVTIRQCARVSPRASSTPQACAITPTSFTMFSA